MKHYKTFGQTNEQVPSAGSTQNHTPIDQIQMQDRPAFHSSAVRGTMQRHQEAHRHQPPMMEHYGQQPPSMMQQYTQPSPSSMQQYAQPPPPMQQPYGQPPPPMQHYAQPPSRVVDKCALVGKHIRQCSSCTKAYNPSNNFYICIIVFLMAVILLLLTKLIDKN